MRPVDRLMHQALEQRHFPGAALLVASDGQPVFHRAYGTARLDTVFDLASLTKPLATTAAVMHLVANGRITLRTPFAEIVPPAARWPCAKVPVWRLLSHCSGLPAWRAFYRHPLGPRPRRAVHRLAAREPLQRAKTPLYSDLGFMLLDWLVERASGQRLDRFTQDTIYGPLGLTRTAFFDLHRNDAGPTGWDVAATEVCPWRGRRLRGEVHDDNCHAMGGISGHAGLFSTAHDVHLITRQLVAAYHGRRSCFVPRIVRRFFDHRRAGSPWALGWDRPARTGAGGKLLSRDAVGHLGFTGTSLWIDLDRSLWVILLTNRVYYGREPNPMPRFRPRLHDAVLRSCV